MSEKWTTEWPEKSGWYWSWVEGEKHDGTSILRPVQVCLSGTGQNVRPIYLRAGHFFYRSEQKDKVVWWLSLDPPKSPHEVPD